MFVMSVWYASVIVHMCMSAYIRMILVGTFMVWSATSRGHAVVVEEFGLCCGNCI